MYNMHTCMHACVCASVHIFVCVCVQCMHVCVCLLCILCEYVRVYVCGCVHVCVCVICNKYQIKYVTAFGKMCIVDTSDFTVM